MSAGAGSERRGDALRRSKISFCMLALLLVLLTILNVVVVLYLDHQRTLDAAYVQVRDLARSVDAHVERILTRADVANNQAIDMVTGLDLAILGDRPDLWQGLRRIAAGVDGDQAMLIFDSTGKAVLESLQSPPRQMTVADRVWFQDTIKQNRAVIGPAVVSRSNGRLVFTASRAIRDQDGRFLGTAAVAVPTSYLTDFFRLVASDVELTIGVYRPDGEVIARRPDAGIASADNMGDASLFKGRLAAAPNGVYQDDSGQDNQPRLIAYTTNATFGVVTYVAMARETALRGWHTRLIPTVSVAVVSLIVSIGALLWGHSSVWRRLLLQAEMNRMLSQRKQDEIALAAAMRDDLTGLCGRSLFLQHARNAAGYCQRVGGNLAFLFVDLDGFKEINDQHGHLRGDQVLKQVADILRQALRDEDLICRLGGDEFVVAAVLPDKDFYNQALSIARRILKQITALGEGIGCSIGVAYNVLGSEDPEISIQNADQAMYYAKGEGKGCVRVFNADTPILES